MPPSKQPRIGDTVNWFSSPKLNEKPTAALVTDVSGPVLSLKLFPPDCQPIDKHAVYHAKSDYIKDRPNVIGRNGVWEWIDVVDEHRQELERKELERKQRLEVEREAALKRQAEETAAKLLRKNVMEKRAAGMDVKAICQSLGAKKEVVEPLVAEYDEQFAVNMANSPS